MNRPCTIVLVETSAPNQTPETEPLPRGKVRLIFGALVVAAAILTLMPHDFDSGGEIVPVAKRKNMPEISMPDLNGGSWKLSDHRGRIVLVNFWASWCGPCREETPALVKLSREYESRGLDITGVAMDDTDQPVRQFVRHYQVSYPVLLPPATSPYVSAISALPTSFLVDKQGRMAKTYVGEISQRALRGDVEHLLTEQ